MADTSFVGESATMLADFQARLRVEEMARKRAIRRTLAGAAVAAVHVAFIVLLIASEWIPVPMEKVVIQPLTWLTLQQQAAARQDKPIKPRKSEQGGYINPEIVPKFVPPKQEEENNAIDLGYALGRSLACGANSYEWLNSKMRSECKHRPWQFVYDRTGNIVLDAAPRVPQQEEKPRPSDIQAHERNTAPLCPQNVDPNAPCLAAIIGGHR